MSYDHYICILVLLSYFTASLITLCNLYVCLLYIRRDVCQYDVCICLIPCMNDMPATSFLASLPPTLKQIQMREGVGTQRGEGVRGGRDIGRGERCERGVGTQVEGKARGVGGKDVRGRQGHRGESSWIVTGVLSLQPSLCLYPVEGRGHTRDSA